MKGLSYDHELDSPLLGDEIDDSAEIICEKAAVVRRPRREMDIEVCIFESMLMLQMSLSASWLRRVLRASPLV